MRKPLWQPQPRNSAAVFEMSRRQPLAGVMSESVLIQSSDIPLVTRYPRDDTMGQVIELSGLYRAISI
jgi:hypothetical protein